jgi:hypothetical protein
MGFFTGVGEATQLRGGTELFFNNTISPTAGVGSYIAILVPEEYREMDQWTPWGLARSSPVSRTGAKWSLPAPGTEQKLRGQASSTWSWKHLNGDCHSAHKLP